MNVPELTNIYVTCGGKSPGLGCYDAVEHRFSDWITLPTGQSVYCVDYDRRTGALWAGTKAGALYRIELQAEAEPLAELVYDPGTHGGILDIAMTNPVVVAIAYTSGVCILYQTDTSEFRQLDTKERVIYALFRPDHGLLAGLANDKLLIWDICCNLLCAMDIPAPANWASLIKPAYFGEAGLWIWPDEEGSLVTYRHAGKVLATRTGHAAPVYGISENGAEVITVGFDDGSLKIWDKNLEVLSEISIPATQVISVFSWNDLGTNLLFTRATGECSVYKLQVDHLDLIADSGPKDCRQAFSLGRQELESAIAEKKNQRAADIARQITNNPGDAVVIEPLHEELIEMGFENISLLLRAEYARTEEDIVGEVSFYHRLFQLSGTIESKMSESLLRYANLLEMLAQVRSANEIFSLLKRFCPDTTFRCREESIEQKLRALEKGVAIINPGGIGVEQIILASQVTNEPVRGRFIIKVLESHAQILPKTSANDYVESFKLNCPDETRPHVIEAAVFDKYTVVPLEAVVFCATETEIKGLELCFSFTHTDSQTQVVPMTVFNFDSTPAENHERVESLLLKYNKCKASPLSQIWLARIHRASDHILRQFITAMKSRFNSFL